MESVGRKTIEQKKSTKTPQTVDTIESFSNQIRKFSQLMILDEFDICYGAAIKVVKQDLKMDKIWTTFALKRSNEEILICLLKWR